MGSLNYHKRFYYDKKNTRLICLQSFYFLILDGKKVLALNPLKNTYLYLKKG